MQYVIKFEGNKIGKETVFIAPWTGDPGRTYNYLDAKKYSNLESANRTIKKIYKDYPFRFPDKKGLVAIEYNPRYLISLKHTHKSDTCITLWGTENSGYAQCRENAGVYVEIEEGYHDRPYDTLPIACDILDQYFIKSHKFSFNGYPGSIILNHKLIWEELGLKMTRNGLVVK